MVGIMLFSLLLSTSINRCSITGFFYTISCRFYAIYYNAMLCIFVSLIVSMNIAIVTGAGGNLGHAVCQKFLAEGYYVAGTISEQEKTDANKPDNYKTVAIDLTDEQATAAFIDAIAKDKGRIDAAVLTVGGFAMGKVENTSTKDIMKQVKLNFETAYNTARPVFLQMMKQGKGKIFLVGSRPGLDMHNSKGMIAYGLSKSLIFRLAELLNDEAKGKEVVTHVIAPSTIDTPQNRKSMPDADPSKWVTPEAIASIIYFYCSDDATVIREPVIKVYNNA